MEKQLLTVAEFCEVVNIGKTMFYQLKKDGKAPLCIKVGKKTLISRAAFINWIRDLEAASTNNNRPAIEETVKQRGAR